jgi:PAS domain S-box-containing protein
MLDGNDSFLKFLGYSSINAEPIINLFANDDDYHHFSNLLKEREQVLDFEVSLVTRSGEQKHCLLNCVFIPNQEIGFFCYQGIIHDLTLRKQAESDMLSAERLSLTGKMARTIAHEVRNPLTNLNLALDQLRAEMPPHNESAKLCGDIIERNANRIEQLVEEMLNSSKPKELNLLLTPANEIVDDTINMAIDRIHLKQIDLQTSLQDNMPRILVDKNKIQMALLNIIINAIEAMTPGLGVLKINSSLHEKVLTISVSDNGKGIPKEEIVKLFDPFFTSKQNGMGLGLTSTKNILNSHNAQIEVQSELNQGTTFFIIFKLAE